MADPGLHRRPGRGHLVAVRADARRGGPRRHRPRLADPGGRAGHAQRVPAAGAAAALGLLLASRSRRSQRSSATGSTARPPSIRWSACSNQMPRAVRRRVYVVDWFRSPLEPMASTCPGPGAAAGSPSVFLAPPCVGRATSADDAAAAVETPRGGDISSTTSARRAPAWACVPWPCPTSNGTLLTSPPTGSSSSALPKAWDAFFDAARHPPLARAWRSASRAPATATWSPCRAGRSGAAATPSPGSASTACRTASSRPGAPATGGRRGWPSGSCCAGRPGRSSPSWSTTTTGLRRDEAHARTVPRARWQQAAPVLQQAQEQDGRT